MLTKRIVLLALCATLVLLGNPWPSLSDDDDDVSPFAGSFFATFNDGFNALFININADGTIVSFQPLAPHGYGSWEETGPFTIEGVFIGVIFTEGALFQRTEFRAVYDPSFNAWTADACVRFFQAVVLPPPVTPPGQEPPVLPAPPGTIIVPPLGPPTFKQCDGEGVVQGERIGFPADNDDDNDDDGDDDEDDDDDDDDD